MSLNLKLNKSPESWRRVSISMVMAGSEGQKENVLRMAIEDVLRLAAELENKQEERKTK